MTDPAEVKALVKDLRKRASAFNDAGLRFGVADLLNASADTNEALLARIAELEDGR